MGQAKLRKVLLEGMAHEDIFLAYKQWCAYNEDLHNTKIRFDDFIGCQVDWFAAVVWFHPRYAKRIRMLLTPHWYTLMKAHQARRK